ncbi:hypothetical protein [Fibrobacter intestinalis]|uniref:hypothetical protein n=1 Tax=Fibrobacter TaxID=832 RepID=UPI00099A0DFC|nr:MULTISPECIES: hypothetical protein [Fibrobacter]PBC74521.1 hypothetical protein BGW94_2182 [Fibrobacter sp. NR9]
MILRGIGVSNFALATAARMGSDKFHEIWLNGRRMGGTFLLFPADNARERRQRAKHFAATPEKMAKRGGLSSIRKVLQLFTERIGE